MLNKIQLIGNVGNEPEQINFDNGGSIVKLPLATSEKWKSKDGEQKEKTSWHNLVFQTKLQDVVLKYVNKGSKLYVEGKLDYNKYQKDGKDVWVTQIKVFNMVMLDSKGQTQKKPLPEPLEQDENKDGDLPF